MLLTDVVLAAPATQPVNQPAAAKPPGQSSTLTRAQVDQVQGGMTLVEVMAVLGKHAEINPEPAPFAYRGEEVVVVWRESPKKWVGVVFVPDSKRTLRVLATGATYLVRSGMP